MRKICALTALSLIFCLALVSGIFKNAGADNRGGADILGRGKRVEVTITNLTRGQIFSPPVTATHTGDLEPLFGLGEPASSELAAIAEDAVNDPLIAVLKADPSVKDVKVITGANGPILPGETASMILEASGKFNQVSLAGMLVTTNDAFFALNGVRISDHTVEVFYSPAYDAGSEENNEKCEFIPGPPCGKAGVRATEQAEGYVHIHAGIHGIGDLIPAQHDWRNPVAKITIRRVQDRDRK